MRKIHFVGIGGIGMSALAAIALSRGDIVSGSDMRPNGLTDALEERGAAIRKGHASDNVPDDADLVVRSTCIRDDNPEIIKAKSLGVPVILRGEMLDDVMAGFPLSVAVTGTHGKTTTSALIAHIAESCGKDPTVIVGGEMGSFGSNAKSGHGDMVVAELDESDGYFRNVSVKCAVVTNIEREHMEHYGSMENLVSAYDEFIHRVPPEGTVVFNGEDPTLKKITGLLKCRALSFGIGGGFDFSCKGQKSDSMIEFDLLINGRYPGRLSSLLIGRHNVMNILAAVAVCVEAGLDINDVIRSVGLFPGVKRRFEMAGRAGGIEVREDYAHHPTEIRSVISSAKAYLQGKGRIIAVFQPHRYSRTRDMMREFSECFYGADLLVLTDIYSADEDITEGVHSRSLYDIVDKSRFEKVVFIGKKDIVDLVFGSAREGDLVLVLGAGDIREIAAPLVRRIGERDLNRASECARYSL